MSLLHRRRRAMERRKRQVKHTREELEAMSAAEVRAIIEELGYTHQNKGLSIEAILNHESKG